MDNLNARRLRQKFWISNTALGTGSINLLEEINLEAMRRHAPDVTPRARSR